MFSVCHATIYIFTHIRGLVADLQKRGVKIELCDATAKAHNYGNEDLLPNIEINTDAMSRTIQLVQEGFVKISES